MHYPNISASNQSRQDRFTALQPVQDPMASRKTQKGGICRERGLQKCGRTFEAGILENSRRSDANGANTPEKDRLDSRNGTRRRTQRIPSSSLLFYCISGIDHCRDLFFVLLLYRGSELRHWEGCCLDLLVSRCWPWAAGLPVPMARIRTRVHLQTGQLVICKVGFLAAWCIRGCLADFWNRGTSY